LEHNLGSIVGEIVAEPRAVVRSLKESTYFPIPYGIGQAMQCRITTLASVQLVSGCGQVLALAVVEVQPRPLVRGLFKRSKGVLTK